jgi:hypothetical protein
LVERLLAKEKVVGSSPFARSRLANSKWQIANDFHEALSSLPFAIRRFGVVAKWQGKGLQNPDQGFKSPRRLFRLLEKAAFCFNSILPAQPSLSRHWKNLPEPGGKES